jgi:hypothetical protein
MINQAVSLFLSPLLRRIDRGRRKPCDERYEDKTEGLEINSPMIFFFKSEIALLKN